MKNRLEAITTQGLSLISLQAAGLEHVEPLVDLDTARRRPQHARGHRPQVLQAKAPVRRHDAVEGRRLRVVHRGEVDRERVAAELDRVAAVGVDQVDERREEGREAAREQLRAVALLRQALRQGREATGVAEDDASSFR